MIKINNLTKTYKIVKVLDSISINIDNNSVYALLGKNGAGKSTLIDLMLDLIKPDIGTIIINNKAHNTFSKEDKLNLGVVSEDLALIEELNGLEYLTFIGKIYKLDKTILIKRIKDLFSYFFEDEKDLNKSIGSYSTGMKKKIAFCAAVLHTPKILILDEPFSGLDPFVANQMIEFLKIYKKNDRIIFISSHDLNYVEKIATHIGVLDASKLVYDSTLEHFTENGEKALDQALLKIIKPNNSELKCIDWV